ncbi:AAA domain-containing protein [Microcoleus sp. Pol14C6]|uniref:AAA domain-containing protein n=1 Tax=unclassified Microcoleus TaxID=2642155 RepID=UPI002FD1012C
MDNTAKVDAILNAWFDYIALEDYSNARIEVANCDKLIKDGITLVDDRVLIRELIFSELRQKATKKPQGQQESVWVLSFPQVFDVDNNGKSYLCPLFSLDVTSILKGDYQEEGWNLDELKLIEAGDNLTKFLGIDDEQREKLITKDGLRLFLETTFAIEFQTYEEWMRQVVIPCSHRPVQRQPYLFEFTGSGFSWNLKKDLKEIKAGLKDWSEGHPAYEYLFGAPQPPEHEVTYMGAFPTHAPTNSQLRTLKHAQSEPVTAVQGPPGSGKTTLILHLVAQQVVKRALRLIESQEDINNLTVVSSTNNTAVDNVIKKLDEWLKDESLEYNFLYIKGGSKNNIQSPLGAIEQIKKAVEYIQKNNFNEIRYHEIKQRIKKIKSDFLAEESNYLEARRQRALDQNRQPHLEEKVQKIKQHLDQAVAARTNFQGRAAELAEYEQLPLHAYQRLQIILETAEMRLPQGNISWWKRILLWFTGRTERQILAKTAEECKAVILDTVGTPFRLEVIKIRSDLVGQARVVRERLEKTDELRRVQRSLQKNSEDIATTEQEKNDVSSELTAITNRLATELQDFYNCFHEIFHDKHQELFKLSREFLTQEALHNKDKVKQTLELYSIVLSDPWKSKDKMAENLDEHIKALSLIFPVITVTLLSVKNMLPWVKECVDRTIVDEAGMIPQHQTFPLLVRSRKAIIVGDPLQIEPVIPLSKQRRINYRQTAFLDRGLTEIDYHRYSPEEEYSATSYHRAAGASGEDNDTGQGICLIEHFRCQPSIIQYCNAIAGYGLEIKTEPVDSLLESHLIAYDVEGNIRNNVNEEEVTAVCEIIQHLVNQGYSLEDIGVISAFRAQANALTEAITKKFSQFNRKSVGTIHTFQGSEKKVIILSTKICRSQDNVSWINKRPNLLNVAVSRAKELFILVANLYRLEKGRLTRQLVEHIREQGIILEYKSEAEIPQQQPGTTPIYDCDHLEIFREAIEEAESEILILSPWIRGNEPKWFVAEIVSALQKGVKVTVIYGNKGNEDNDNNDAQAEKELRDLFSHHPGSRLIRLGKEIYRESRGTNERILICDDKFAVIGSWNWLSHPYREQCRRRLLINPKVQIRREMSIQLSDSSFIADFKARIYKLIT